MADQPIHITPPQCQSAGSNDPIKVHSARIVLFFAESLKMSAPDAVTALGRGDGAFPATIAPYGDTEAGGIEMAWRGLTFALRGFSPAPPPSSTGLIAAYGFDGKELPGMGLAAEFLPGDHIAAGAALQPVLRAWLGLAANLAMRLPVAAVGWTPAGTIMAPGYFSLNILNWLSGGTFPAPGLAALREGADGSVYTKGLDYIIGHEIYVERKSGEPRGATFDLTARLADRFVRLGVPAGPCEIVERRERLLAELSQAGRRISIWRERN